MTRNRSLSILMAALLLAAGISCSSDSVPTGIPAPDASASVSTAVSPSLLGGLLGTVDGTLDGTLGTVGGTLDGTIDGTLGTLSQAPILGPLLTCGPQPYAADTLVVGRQGGTLHIGPHTLVIPEGALRHKVRIIGEAPSDRVVSVRFQPEGLTFDKRHPAQLTLDYSSCGLVANILPKHIVYTDEQLNVLSVLTGSLDNMLTDQVSAPVKHFSRYVIAF